MTFTPPKTSRAVREIPLTAQVVARLREHKAAQARDRLAFGGAWDLDLVIDNGLGEPIDPDSLTHAFLKVAKRAGVEGVRLHDLRHYVGTRLGRSGLALFETSAVMGHSSPAFTASTYQHADEASVERTRAALEGAFGQ